jgi:GT2 family glycosyltransferase/ubiquinone/menaquinone biosynthesis C-methylase UbiE
LDIACGEGYGSEMLSRNAESVVGVDIDPATVAHATKKYQSPNLKFLEGTCEEIPLPNKSVDLLVSYETLEHIEDHGRFLSEAKRVLSAKGMLVISTPEKSVYSDASGQRNPFHKKELYRTEFLQLLSSFFPKIITFEQKLAFGSHLVSSLDKTQGFLTVQLEKLPASAQGERGLGGAVYLVAVCSRVALPPLCNSLCEQKMWESETWIKNLNSKEESIKGLGEELKLVRQFNEATQTKADEISRKAAILETRLLSENSMKEEVNQLSKVVMENGKRLADLKHDMTIQRDFVDNLLAQHRKAQQEAVEKSVGGLKEELAQQRKAQQEAVEKSVGGLKEELAQQRKTQQEAVEKSVGEVKREIVAEIHSLIANLVEQGEKNRFELSARVDSVKEGMEGRVIEVGEYAAKIRQAVVSPSSILIPAPFSWYSYLYKMLNIREPVWLNKEKRTTEAPKRPGFWRRLERSIRKRRKRWINRIGFDRDWYLKEYPDVAHAGIEPLDHYIQFGIQEGRWKSKKDKQNRPNPHKKRGFEDILLGKLWENIRKQLWHLWSYPRVKAQLKLNFRLLEKNFPFDPIWYQVKYPDVKGTSMPPFMHFIEYGAPEGRMPNRRFSQECYLALAPEVASSGTPASLHFLMEGWEEGRLTNWLDRYVEQSFDREIRVRIGGLLDLLLAEEDPEDLSGARERKISLLRNRFSLALRNRAAPTEEPKVSIIIPVYNQVAYTLACVTSLYESDPSTTFEVIIADDCSNDGTREIFKEFSPWIKMVRTSGNLGFLRNCNHAAKTAKGEFIVFLNNDMLLLPEWLDSLVSTIVADPECGMVGSKLLNLDGTLQEAGGIFWNDGSAWNYGRRQNPMAHEFNYKKEVDYCSGASICLRKEVWDAVGGFDEIYAPAYCEESDLAFRLRARGLKTIYQPRSVGIHLEGVTHGTDIANGIKTYQVKNLKKLQDRWSDILKKEHFPNAEQVFLARDRSAKKRHMLFVDHYLPRPDYDAGSKQIATYLQLFVEMGFQISFWPDNLGYDKEYALPLEELGIEVISCNGGLITFEQWIKKNGQHLDVAFLVRPYIALKYINGLKENSNASIVYYGVDIHFIRTKGELILNPTDKALIARVANEEDVETECWEKADLTLYPSFEECQYIREHFPTTKTDLLPLYCKSDEEISAAKTTTEFSKRSGILFVGGFDHTPNKDGILWFYNEILPLIREILPNLSLTIAGSNPPAEVRRLESKFIKVTGRVSDQQLSAFYENHRAAIAPLRFGGGVKGKVVESLLKGLPIVTTSIGSQGLCNSVKALSIAFSEQDFCEKVIALHQIENKWIEQRKSGIKYFEDNFSSRCIIPNLTKLLGNKKVNTSVKQFL